MNVVFVRAFRFSIIGGFLATAALLASGCGGPAAAPKKEAKSEKEAATAAADAMKDRCDSLLASIVDMVQPEHLEISASRVLCTETLNNWKGTCSPTITVPVASNAAEIEKLLTPELLKSLGGEVFDGRDVDHIRDCLIARQSVDTVIKGGTSDLDRVVRIFYHVVRNISLEPANQPNLSMAPYEILMLGHGTAEDRAWIFAEMLRQLHIDAVVIRPEIATAPPAATAAEPAKEPTAAEPKATETKPAETKPAAEPATKTDEAPKPAETKSPEAAPAETKPADAKPAAESKSEEPKPTEDKKTDDEKPAAAQQKKFVTKPWLVGVLLDKQVYLFDTRLGLPIPTAADTGDTALPTVPATLKDVVANDALLRKLDVSPENPYAIKAEDLKKVRAEIICDSRFFTARMRVLNSLFPPDDGRTVLLYDELGDVDGGKGLVTRVAEGGEGAWTREQISLWSRPDKAWSGSLNRDKQTAQMIQFLWSPFDAVVKVDFDPEKGAVLGDPSKLQLKSRTSQVIGDLEAAVKTYLGVQISELPKALPIPTKILEALAQQAAAQKVPLNQIPRYFKVPDDVWLLQARATQDAMYWVAITHYEQGEYAAAVESCANFFKKYQDKSAWSAHVAALTATAQAQLKHYAEAVQSMNRATKLVRDDHPQRDSWLWLSNRWRALRTKEEAKEEKKEEKSAGEPEKKTQPEPEKKAEPETKSEPEKKPETEKKPEAEVKPEPEKTPAK